MPASVKVIDKDASSSDPTAPASDGEALLDKDRADCPDQGLFLAPTNSKEVISKPTNDEDEPMPPPPLVESSPLPAWESGLDLEDIPEDKFPLADKDCLPDKEMVHHNDVPLPQVEGNKESGDGSTHSQLDSFAVALEDAHFNTIDLPEQDIFPADKVASLRAMLLSMQAKRDEARQQLDRKDAVLRAFASSLAMLLVPFAATSSAPAAPEATGERGVAQGSQWGTQSQVDAKKKRIGSKRKRRYCCSRGRQPSGKQQARKYTSSIIAVRRCIWMQ